MSVNTADKSVDYNKVEYIASKFIVHKFSELISERKILYQVIKMTDSLIIFINDKDNMQLSNIFVSLISQYDDLPIGTKILGNFTEEAVSKNMAQRMSKKLKKTVYVSCNLEEDSRLLPLVEKRIYEEIKLHEDKF